MKKINSKSVAWKQNFLNVFKGIKKWKFWGRKQSEFLLRYPEEIDVLIKADLEKMFDNFSNLDPKGRELTQRKYMTILMMTALGVEYIEETDKFGRPNENDLMQEFIRLHYKQLEEDFGYVKDKSRKKQK